MLIYNIVTALCLFVMLLITFFVIKNIFFKKSRAERLKRIRKFKKGQCAVIFIPAVPLYFIGKLYALIEAGSDLSLFDKIMSSIISTINNLMIMIVLRYDISQVATLAYANAFYKWTVYLLYLLLTVNAALFALSVFYQKVSYVYNNHRFKKAKTEAKRIILGYNKNSLDIYKSCEASSAVIADLLSDSDQKELFDKGVAYTLLEKRPFGEWFSSLYKYSDKSGSAFTVIINFEDEERNLSLCGEAVKYLTEIDKFLQNSSENDEEYDRLTLSFYKNLRFFVFGNPSHEDLYHEYEKKSKGFIHFINKYHAISRDFIFCHPMAKYMTENEIDYSTSLLKAGVKLNCAFVGFGKTSQQLFLASVANNQFLAGDSKAPYLLPVNYHIFDKNCSENTKNVRDGDINCFCDKNLNHNYFRFYHEVLEKLDSLRASGKSDEAEALKQKYLPLPCRPSVEKYYHLNINDYDFYKALYKAFTPCESGERCVNFALVAFGSDLENMDMANKLSAKAVEWGLQNLHIFVKIRDDRLAAAYKENLIGTNCHVIGNERKIVFNIEAIENRKIERMAIERDKAYKNGVSRDLILNEDKNRYKDHPTVRLSNIYCCLSLRSKLNLMGFDLATEGEDKSTEFLKAYSDPLYEKYLADLENEGFTASSELADYCECFIDTPYTSQKSLRTLLAVQEHYRWNSFMISNGFVPATVEEIKTTEKRGKSYPLRRHGNITTMEGLIEFRKIASELCGDSSKDKQKAADVIKYDYQILDNALAFLKNEGFKIVKK